MHCLTCKVKVHTATRFSRVSFVQRAGPMSEHVGCSGHPH
jgi:hypothetical protein